MNTDGSFRNVINLGNSIIGVSILAMPYCFHKCGILLSILIILASGGLTKATCHLLLKAAIMGRRRNFEFLAFHTFGTMGKFAVELGIIGFLLGTCIAFFVVVGDLGPPLASDLFLLENTTKLRIEVLLILGFFVGLPLGLLKRVESLTSCSTLSVCFYIFLIFKILAEALPNLSYEKLVYEMNWWQPSGLLSCLPIFAMALSCQTQLFEIFDPLNDPSLKKMDSVVSSAVHLCSVVYTLVGLFGYVAFYNQPISGNILVKLPGTDLTKFIKLCFVLTVVVSFPLCLFPCRSSLHSLIFKPGVSVHEMPGNLIPDHRFRLLTFLLVAVTIGTAIMVPNIEFVLGILGSTIGAIISFILPAMVFIRMTNKNTNERLLAKFVLCVGLFILIACSYSTLNESAHSNVIEKPHLDAAKPIMASPAPKINEEKIYPKIENPIPVKPTNAKVPPDIVKFDEKVEIDKKVVEKVQEVKEFAKESEKRQEPPIPQEPEEVVVKIKEKELEAIPSLKVEEKPKVEPVLELKAQVETQPEVNKPPVLVKDPVIPVSNTNSNDIDPDALKKEDKELKNSRLAPNLSEQSDKKAEKKAEEAERKAEAAEKKAEEASQKQDELLRKIEAQQREQKKLLEEQRKLLLELKEHKETHHKEDEVHDKEGEVKVVPEKSELHESKQLQHDLPVTENERSIKKEPIVVQHNTNRVDHFQFQDNLPLVKKLPKQIVHDNTINQIVNQRVDTNNMSPSGNAVKSVNTNPRSDSNQRKVEIKPPVNDNRDSKPQLVVDTRVKHNSLDDPVPVQSKRLISDTEVRNAVERVKLPEVSKKSNTHLKTDAEMIADAKRSNAAKNFDIPVAKRLSDSFQNKKPSEHEKPISKRSVTADPYDSILNLTKFDATKNNPSKISYADVKNEIRKLLSYREKQKRKK